MMKMPFYSDLTQPQEPPLLGFPQGVHLTLTHPFSEIRQAFSKTAGGSVNWCKLKKKKKKRSRASETIIFPQGVLKGLTTSEKLFTFISNQ